MNNDDIDRAVELLSDARNSMTTFASLPDQARPKTLDDGYKIQLAFIERHGEKIAGWKVGATGQVAKTLFAVDEPFLGPVFASKIYRSPARIERSTLHHACIECEFAFRIGRTLPPRALDYSRFEVMDAIDDLIPVFELVSPRYDGIPKGDGPSAIADCGLNGGLVLGTPRDDVRGVNLISQRVVYLVDGVEVAVGDGSMVLGDPIVALQWTINKLSSLGVAVKERQVISTGTCTGIHFIEAGQKAVGDFGPLGRVEAVFV